MLNGISRSGGSYDMLTVKLIDIQAHVGLLLDTAVTKSII